MKKFLALVAVTVLVVGSGLFASTNSVGTSVAVDYDLPPWGAPAEDPLA